LPQLEDMGCTGLHTTKPYSDFVRIRVQGEVLDVCIPKGSAGSTHRVVRLRRDMFMLGQAASSIERQCPPQSAMLELTEAEHASLWQKLLQKVPEATSK
jgi:hypothetical protein